MIVAGMLHSGAPSDEGRPVGRAAVRIAKGVTNAARIALSLFETDHMEQDNLQLIRSFGEAYTAAWCSQDAASVAAFYEETGSLSVNQDAPAVGRQAITEVAQGFMTAFPDMQVFLDDVRLQDGGAIYHWTLTGTNTGPSGTGRAVRISGFEVWQIGDDGLIASSRGNFDSAEYHRQLGS